MNTLRTGQRGVEGQRRLSENLYTPNTPLFQIYAGQATAESSQEAWQSPRLHYW